MSSSDEEDFLAIVNLNNLNRANMQRRCRRRFWVHPFWVAKRDSSAFNIFKELNVYPDKFMVMSQETFQVLVNRVKPFIEKKDTNYRLSVSTEERLLITLR